MTTPRVVTVWPASGEVAPVPWISAIVRVWGPGGGGTQASPHCSGVGGLLSVKSALLLAVLVCAASRVTEVAPVVAGAAAVPAKSFADPHPTKSTTCGSCEQLLAQAARAVAVLTSATLPPLPPMGITPSMSAGTSTVPPVPEASPTTRDAPAGSTPVRSVFCQVPVPVVELYCTDQPSSVTAVALTLASSMKSRR